MLNPSVSPFKISANGLVVESSNPAVRLYRYNTFSGEVSKLRHEKGHSFFVT